MSNINGGSRGTTHAGQAAKLASSGTPSFYINGLFLSGAKPFEAFKVVIDKELAAKKKT